MRRRAFAATAITAAVAGLVTGPGLVAAQPAPIFHALSGSWEGEGTLMGRHAAFSMTWEVRGPVATLTFENGFAGEAGVTPVLRADAVYRTSPSVGDAVWMDNRGERVEIRWETTDSTLVSRWEASSESGRTTYRITGEGTVEVIDEVRGPEGLRVFGEASYRRVESRPAG